ncbi:MAG: hypothetical protein HC913_02965 [Microscillaceae bacterium]|nr:hypothetical protein [Microscillaceae bacterium]
MNNQLEAQPYELATYKARLIPALQSYPEGATLAQLVVKTGLPLEWTEYTLRQMLPQYPAHLEINAQHELVYLFDFSPRSLSFTQMLVRGGQAFLQGLWRLFVWVFKAWIVLMLCSYLLFNMLVLVLGISMLTRSSTLFEGTIKAMREVFRGLGRLWAGSQASQDNLLQAVFSYVFGPQAPPAESQALEKRILAFIQQNGGKINVGQLIKLTGWSLRQAEEQAAQLMAQYQGDAEVSELGTITYLFPALENQPREHDFSSEALMIWHHPQPLLRLNDNPKDTNEKITLINAFNLGMSFLSPLLLYLLFFDGEEFSDTLLFLR